MGILFNTNTWRAPLLLIDSWLPLAPSTHHSNAHSVLPRTVRRFARAGWLGHPTFQATPKTDASPVAVHHHPGATVRGSVHPVRVLHAAETPHGIRQDARLVIAGRISEVCAELDRLAALEQPHGTA